MDYKVKLEEAKRLYQTANADQKYVLESLFPELRESEDERIRKVLVDYFKRYKEQEECGIKTFFGIPTDNIIAWLEKQGEKKTSVVDFKAKDWYVSKVDGKIYNAKFMEKTPTNQARKLEIEKAAMSATGIIKQEEWFIKGAEWSDKNPSYICSEKQNEQKPTDKVEPKFKVGDWIVWQNKCYKVNDNGCGYELIDQNGLSTSLEYGTVDKSAHLWAIQDAKDGDVLAFKNNVGGIIICKSPTNYDTRSYCRLIRDNLINKEESGWDSTLFVPATKEQRDTLLKAMADAGYTFDFGKKELKKIEKKSQRMVSAEVKEALYDKPTDEEMKELLRTEYEKGATFKELGEKYNVCSSTACQIVNGHRYKKYFKESKTMKDEDEDRSD